MNVDWDNPEKTVVRLTFIGDWTWDEVREAARVRGELLSQVDYTVDIINDLRQSNGLPIGSLDEGRRIDSNRPANAGMSVVIGLHPLLRAMAGVFMRLRNYDRNRFRVVADDDEAYAVIDEVQRARIAQDRP